MLDAESYSDHPALFAQEPRHATGVEHLLINGTPVIENGRLTHALPGHVIRNELTLDQDGFTTPMVSRRLAHTRCSPVAMTRAVSSDFASV